MDAGGSYTACKLEDQRYPVIKEGGFGPPFSMARRVLDYNPTTGETCYFEYNEVHDTPQVILTHEQDVQPILDMCAVARNDEDKTKRGIKQDNWKYAIIPAIIQIEMLEKYGVDFNDPAQQKEVFHLINTVYQRFKTTHKNHMQGTDKKYYISAIKPATDTE